MRRATMVLVRARIEQLEKELAEAKAQLAQEDGERFRVIWREIAQEERERILDGLTDRHERIIFGLDVPEEPERFAGGKAGKSGGDLSCDICGKSGLTRRGLGLHKVRKHKGEGSEEEPGGLPAGGAAAA
jgi:hypothetical protein